ncbi:MAG: transcriptional repressor LexA [Spirochaetes bacterium]|nr:transcriptional repressor LexA [Spirochaetota bacterium]
MAKDLTDKQQLILSFIKEMIHNSGFPPTVREIGDKFGITVKGAYDHLKAIEKKGYIKTEQNKSRAMIIVDDDTPKSSGINIPLLGRIAAGSPILAVENIEDYLSFPKGMFKSGEYFALKVKGDSMIECGIFDGDIAVIKKQNSANNGDIVAALIDEEATLKEFQKSSDSIKLLPKNAAYKPIIRRDVSIMGKLAAVFRTYR